MPGSDSTVRRAARGVLSAWVRWSRYRSWFRSGIYRFSDLPAAFGFLPASVRQGLQGRPGSIVVSALGLGEMVNCIPLIRRLQRLSSLPIIVLSRNPRQVSKLASAEGIQVIALPYPFTSLRFLLSKWLRTLRPRLILAMETLEELRVGLLRQAKEEAHARVLLLNHTSPLWAGPHWRRLEAQWEQEGMIPLIDGAGATSNEAVTNLLAQGLPPDRVEKLPNIKFDVARHEAARSCPDRERARLRLQPTEHVLIFGSVYPEELALLLEAYAKVRAHPGLEGTRLILAPRYIQHVPRIMEQITRARLTAARMTGIGTEPCIERPIIVVDTAGDLRRLYAIADVAVVAGSLTPKQHGHNPIEPAAFGTAVVIGPYASSFSDIVSSFSSQEAIIQLEQPEDLAEEIITLLEDPAARRRLGNRARQVVAEASGAEGRYLERIAAMSVLDPGPSQRVDSDADPARAM